MIHFIVLQKKNILLITNNPLARIRDKYGSNFEIVNSIKDESHLETIKQRVVRQYPRHEVVEKLRRPVNFTEEVREKIRQSKLGKKRDEATRAKISSKMKGTSNFEGKKHQESSRRKTSQTMQGYHNLGDKKHFIYNPRTNEEKRIANRHQVPVGYRLGRDPEFVWDSYSRPRDL